jgi:hypothetical protein
MWNSIATPSVPHTGDTRPHLHVSCGPLTVEASAPVTAAEGVGFVESTTTERLKGCRRHGLALARKGQPRLTVQFCPWQAHVGACFFIFPSNVARDTDANSSLHCRIISSGHDNHACKSRCWEIACAVSARFCKSLHSDGRR